MKLQAVRGMNDMLPDQGAAWQFFERTAQDWLAAYGYREIRMPILEQTGLFKRAIGEVTDIVEKEMYTFVDELNGESLTLRPEGTASCVRAVIQHNLLYDGGKRLWYAGPMFRHERPQKGRYRQFHQIGVETFGFDTPDVDAEHILMGADLWKRLGIAPTLQLNTLGDSEARRRHRERLIKYLESNLEVLDEDAKRRLHTNPLRILDTKNPALQDLVEAAPRLMDDLDESSLIHFEAVQKWVRAAGVEFEINTRLVRGLDYYNRTVFEWVTDQLGAQGTVCAGGRYDGLVEQLGGKPAPACGFAMGIERLLALMDVAKTPMPTVVPDAYLVHAGEAASANAWRAAAALRRAGLSVLYHLGGGSFKSQMKKADASGARYALIVGDEEVAAGQLTVKALREEREQARMTVAEIEELMKH
jgi:histidyl-tRNA synthetase